jgi:hypothetical protein
MTMTKPVYWIHDKALSNRTAISSDAIRRLFIWDDAYLKRQSYSFKRLVFIYETLCEMNIEVLRGDTLTILGALAPSHITTNHTTDTTLKKLITTVSQEFEMTLAYEPAFVRNIDIPDARRFFKYWKKANKNAFLINGGED